jgi:hypothetical protein
VSAAGLVAVDLREASKVLPAVWCEGELTDGRGFAVVVGARCPADACAALLVILKQAGAIPAASNGEGIRIATARPIGATLGEVGPTVAEFFKTLDGPIEATDGERTVTLRPDADPVEAEAAKHGARVIRGPWGVQ